MYISKNRLLIKPFSNVYFYIFSLLMILKDNFFFVKVKQEREVAIKTKGFIGFIF